jgi:hypothetical protein
VTPMGEQLCYADAYVRSVGATVRHVETGAATLVVLDRTVFYPGGGGRGPSPAPGRSVARSSTSWRRPTAIRPLPATRSRWTSIGRAGSC